MKRSLNLYICGLTAVLLASCATGPKDNTAAVSKPSEAGAAGQNNDIGPRLNGQDLPRGECGLFVWSGDQDRRFILFSQSQKNKAVWAGPNGDIPLVLVETLGQAFQEQFTHQGFAEKTAIEAGMVVPTLTLSLRNIEELLGSTRFKEGTFTQVMQDGLERVMPVVGLSTCR